MNKTLFTSGLCLSAALMITQTAIAAPTIQSAPKPLSHITFINQSDADLQSAKDFVTKVADQGINFLSDDSITLEQRKKEFKKLLSKNFSMKTIARFSLGRYWRTATPAQQKEYLDLFEEMILNVYARRFSEYSGEKLTVSNARAEGKRDILVHSSVSAQKGPDIKVDWRIRNKNGKNKVIDIIVEGVSMSLTQRSDFSSVIQRGGGDIEVLLEHLRAQK
jgi:phospholipid transport system substrate-binding protein